jgi:ADP-ribose pyrophosphatase
MHAFVATGLEAVGQKLEDTEEITVHLVSTERVREMLHDGTIHDGKTMAAIYRYFADESDR